MDIILASASPRRKELLSQIGIDFDVIISDVDENVNYVKPYRIVEELSKRKAGAVVDSLEDTEKEVLVIGADTLVSCDGQVMGKPKNSKEAVKMLKLLQGRVHEVYTGVSVVYRQSNEMGGEITQKTFHECTKVHFYPMTDDEIKTYVATGESMDKAGAYAVQGLCAKYISGVNGDYNNVVGLPVGRLYQEIKEWL